MDYISKISFPGLGIGEFSVHNVAFRTLIFKYPVMWYGVIICVGIILAFAYFSYRAGKTGVKFDDVIDLTLITVPVAVIGARIYYVIFYGGADSFYDFIAIWNGGLAIYGAIIFGAIAVICGCLYKKLDFFKLADMIIPAVMIGQILGRWGNFCNGEAFGGIVSESSPLYFLRMGLQNGNTWEKFGTVDMVFVHPTFLYESMWNLLGFILINIFYKKKKYNGEVLLWYLAWYGFGRMFIEQLRTDSLYIGNTGLRVSALVGFICAVVAIPLIIIFRVLCKKYKKSGAVADGVTVSVPYFFGVGRNKFKSASDIASDTVTFNTEEFERAESEKDDENAKEAKKRLFNTDTSETVLTGETVLPENIIENIENIPSEKAVAAEEQPADTKEPEEQPEDKEEKHGEDN